MEREFSAPWDKITTAATGLVFALCVTAVAISRSPWVAGLCGIVLLCGWLWSPRGYVVTSDSIEVKRPIGNRTIPLSAIREIRPTESADFGFCIKLWGSGGFFGHYGLYRTARFPKAWWYMTDRRNSVVAIGEKVWFFSPDDIPGFLDAAKRERPAMNRSGLQAPGFESDRGPLWLAPVIGAIVVASVVGLLVYSPGPPTVTLTSDSLEIHDRFYPVTLNASAVDVSGVRVVDFDSESAWKPVMRTNGFGAPHYKSGWFRLENGKTVRMYRADGHRLILLPGRGTGDTVLLESANPEQLIAEVHQRWQR